MTDSDCRAKWQDLLAYVRDRYTTEVVDASAEYMEGWRDACDGIEGAMLRLAGQPTPDPDHVPAVHRMVTWDGGRGRRREEHEAYRDAAMDLLHRSIRRLRPPPARRRVMWWHYWDEERVQRLAAYLQRRDEERGHR